MKLKIDNMGGALNSTQSLTHRKCQ